MCNRARSKQDSGRPGQHSATGAPTQRGLCVLMGPEHAETSNQPSTGGILSVPSSMGVCELKEAKQKPRGLAG